MTKEEKMEKDVFLQIRMEKERRDLFKKICNDNAVNSSALLRKWIDKYIEQHKEQLIETHLPVSKAYSNK